MAELTAPGGASGEQVRLGRDAPTTVANLGPLADLVGTWIGTQGWELIAVPSGGPGGLHVHRQAVRGGHHVHDDRLCAGAEPRRARRRDVHLRGGVRDTHLRPRHERAAPPRDRDVPEPLRREGRRSAGQPIARSATIPHGDSVLALGTSFDVAGPPDITPRSGVPDAGPDAPLGYTNPWQVEIPSPCDPASKFNPAVPTQVLTDQLDSLKAAGTPVVKTTTLSLSTENGGGIVNIPFVDANANAARFDCVFWIETIEVTPPDGGEPNFVQQLQYFQQTNIEFLPQFGGPPGALIMWPHVNVNTMRKQ
jgi:hypothetical protein